MRPYVEGTVPFTSFPGALKRKKKHVIIYA